MLPFRLKYIPFETDLRGKVFGFTAFRGNKAIVFIDNTRTQGEQAHTLKHELSHILLGHFLEEQKTIEEMEREAGQHADAMTDQEFQTLLSYQIK